MITPLDGVKLYLLKTNWLTYSVFKQKVNCHWDKKHKPLITLIVPMLNLKKTQPIKLKKFEFTMKKNCCQKVNAYLFGKVQININIFQHVFLFFHSMQSFKKWLKRKCYFFENGIISNYFQFL